MRILPILPLRPDIHPTLAGFAVQPSTLPHYRLSQRLPVIGLTSAPQPCAVALRPAPGICSWAVIMLMLQLTSVDNRLSAGCCDKIWWLSWQGRQHAPAPRTTEMH